RDGASPAGFLILAHFIDHEIKSPYWDKPISSVLERKYERTQASIFPLQPRLSAKLIFVANGRSASSPETILQYARAAGLGIIVGEPTGGTNGDVATFDSLNGISVRFTGLRALNQDGSVLHGRGITPDVVAHPTAAGIRDGRDEILEAAISRAMTP
ncbi:MAG TPA: S41 family peptidase, partial [Kofleriaceae bacterium]